MGEKWGTSIKISDRLKEKVDSFVNDKSYNYKSRSGFIIKAVEKEIETATILQTLNKTGRIYFDDMLRQERWKVFEKAKTL